MKKPLAALLALCLLCFCAAASANQWGVTGPLLTFLRGTHGFDDYYYVYAAPDGGEPYTAAVVSNLDHSQLLALKRDADGTLSLLGRYPAAVWQPDGKTVHSWTVAAFEGGGFELTLTDEDAPETCLAFDWSGYDVLEGEALPVLREARVGGLSFTPGEESAAYSVTDGTETARWQTDPLALESFSLERLPQSLDEVRALNALRAYLGSDPCYYSRVTVDLRQDASLPVYAAPSEAAWRGAKGKAVVSLREPFRLLASNEDNGWWLIEYEISASARRIGWVRRPKDVRQPCCTLYAAPVACTLSQAASLTDDPHGSGREIARLAAGDNLTVLGWADACWAYAETEIDGRQAYAFVPLSALAQPQEEEAADAAARLWGTWRFVGGGELLGMGMVFHADGTCTPCAAPDGDASFPPEALIPTENACAFSVYADPAQADAYVLVIEGPEGALERYRLTWEEADGAERFLVAQGEAGGGYERWEKN
ncbi:MAG: hypothetical protein PHY12_16325 [Eubacteriales bacterium]|nr:hypothetical protein [Eubacteriales bacterium]